MSQYTSILHKYLHLAFLFFFFFLIEEFYYQSGFGNRQLLHAKHYAWNTFFDRRLMCLLLFCGQIYVTEEQSKGLNIKHHKNLSQSTSFRAEKMLYACMFTYTVRSKVHK